MFYFAVTFEVIIDGDLADKGLAGVISKIQDYRRNAIKITGIEFYKKKYNTRKPVSLIITGFIQPLTQSAFEKGRKGFTFIIEERELGFPL